jgi:hypothetical protein
MAVLREDHALDMRINVEGRQAERKPMGVWLLSRARSTAGLQAPDTAATLKLLFTSLSSLFTRGQISWQHIAPQNQRPKIWTLPRTNQSTAKYPISILQT